MEQIIEYLKNSYIELIGAIAGFINVYLNTKANPRAWPFGIVSVLAYLYVFLSVSLYGDFILHLFYLGISIYGWYNWVKGGNTQQGVPISTLSQRWFVMLLGMGAVGMVAMYYVFSLLPHPAVPMFDAFTTAFSFVAVWMLANKKIENWLVWIAVDSVAAGVYVYKGLYVSALLYTVFLVLAVKGFINWRKQLSRDC